MLLSRRSLFRAAPLLLAAPAIVKIASIMPVKVMPAELYGASPMMLSVQFLRAFNQHILEVMTYGSSIRLLRLDANGDFELAKAA